MPSWRRGADALAPCPLASWTSPPWWHSDFSLNLHREADTTPHRASVLCQCDLPPNIPDVLGGARGATILQLHNQPAIYHSIYLQSTPQGSHSLTPWSPLVHRGNHDSPPPPLAPGPHPSHCPCLPVTIYPYVTVAHPFCLVCRLPCHILTSYVGCPHSCLPPCCTPPHPCHVATGRPCHPVPSAATAAFSVPSLASLPVGPGTPSSFLFYTVSPCSYSRLGHLTGTRGTGARLHCPGPLNSALVPVPTTSPHLLCR